MTHGAYNPLLVAGSILIAILASYTALDLANRLTAARGRVRLLWLIAGSLAMGLGIWSMHYTAMRAMTFTPLTQRVSIGREDVLATDGLAVAVALTTMLVLAIALASAIIDRALAHQAAIAEEAERRRRDAEESEARFRELPENIHEVFWIFTPNFSRTLYVSPAYEDIWGRSREMLYRNPQVFIETVHPDDRARMREMLARLREKEASAECRIVRPDGAVRWVRNREFPVRDASGQIRRVVGITEDITEP